MTGHEGETAVNHHAPILSRVAAVALISLSAAGCNVIKPELLAAVVEDAPAQVPADAAMSDAPLGNLVSNPDLEQGIMGWITNGGGMPEPWSGDAHGGTKCLLFSGRTDYWQGPAVVLTTKVRPGKQYAMSAWVRLVDPGIEDFKVSIRHTCAEDGMQRFNEGVTQPPAHVNDNATWVQPTGTFRVVEAEHCMLTELIVYVETVTRLPASSAYPSFYLDDVEVAEMFP